MSLDERRRHEQEKYRRIFSGAEGEDSRASYLRGCHGCEALPLIERLAPRSVIDIGCAGGVFPRLLHERGIRPVTGVDFVLPDTVAPAPGLSFVEAPAHATGLETVDMVTSFDMLEHLLPEEVDEVLREFRRLARRWVLVSICYRPSRRTAMGEGLHMTVRSEKWWMARLQAAFGVAPRRRGPYLFLEMEGAR